VVDLKSTTYRWPWGRLIPAAALTHSNPAGDITMAKTPEIKSSINSYERRPGLDSREVKFDVPEQDVDHARTAETGIALADVRGIEVDPMTANTKKLLADEKFMAEPVEIQLADPGTEDEHQFAEITVKR